MLAKSVARIVSLCVTRPWLVIALAVALAVGSGIYAKQRFALDTNIEDLLSPSLAWVRRGHEFERYFPEPRMVVVLNAPTPELVDEAAGKLQGALQAHPDRFHSVVQLDSGSFFRQNGLLFLSVDQLKNFTHNLTRADELIGTLASDPSLRGSLDALSLVMTGVERKEVRLDDVAPVMNVAADTAEAVLAGRPASFSWQVLASGRPATASDLRRIIQVDPVLDFNALQPGGEDTDLVQRLSSDLKLSDQYQTRVRLTGLIPIGDDEFATIKQHAARNATISLLAVLTILWLALHSLRIIVAVMLGIAVGFAVTLAIGLSLVGTLNVMSVAFFALFVGVGIDFGIQFSVRYRAERHDLSDLRAALLSAARKIAVPLSLAAVATAIGFSSFLPTSYRGLSELGEIAGVGMIVAFLISITLLPALLTIFNPPGEPSPMGFAALAPIDRFLMRHRIPIVIATIALVVLASPLLFFLRFDFDANHLRSPSSPSMEAYLELRNDPQVTTRSADVVAPNLARADAVAQEMARLPQVSQTRTLSSLVPTDQDAKLKLIRDGAKAIDQSLNPKELEPSPSDKDVVDDLNLTAVDLNKAAASENGTGAAAAKRLSQLLIQLAKADPATRARADNVIAMPLRLSLDHLRSLLKAQRVSVKSIPPELARLWVTSDGRARVEVLPKGDPDDTPALRNFVSAVLAADPSATGPAVTLFEAGNTVVHSFVQAGIFALGAISVLLLVVLRRVSDVLLTLVPLIIAAVVTLELCVVLGMQLNFANIIALPLLLGVGVAFKIYYIEAWRAGRTNLLQSSLTRAVFFSALTTATAFGTLWLSSHPGTSSMGKLMSLSLVCTMAAAVLFQPVLMGSPRKKEETVSAD
jgi:uncharacterized protein